MTTNKTCPVCGEAVDPARAAKHSNVIVCGKSKCSLEHARVRLNRNRKSYRRRRIATDPEFRLRERQRGRAAVYGWLAPFRSYKSD